MKKWMKVRDDEELCGRLSPPQSNSYELTSQFSSEARDAHRPHPSSLPLLAVHLISACRSPPGL